MTGSLTPAQRTGFARDGYLSPVAALTPGEAQGLLDTISSFETTTGLVAGDVIRMKGHSSCWRSTGWSPIPPFSMPWNHCLARISCVGAPASS